MLLSWMEKASLRFVTWCVYWGISLKIFVKSILKITLANIYRLCKKQGSVSWLSSRDKKRCGRPESLMIRGVLFNTPDTCMPQPSTTAPCSLAGRQPGWLQYPGSHPLCGRIGLHSQRLPVSSAQPWPWWAFGKWPSENAPCIALLLTPFFKFTNEWIENSFLIAKSLFCSLDQEPNEVYIRMGWNRKILFKVHRDVLNSYFGPKKNCNPCIGFSTYAFSLTFGRALKSLR